MLFSPNRRRKPGPKGPNAELVRAVVEMKQHNPTWGCPRIAQQITLAFHIQIDKDVVRRILAHHYLPGQDSGGPSWLTFLGHMKQPLEYGSVQVRVGHLADPLSPGGHGSIYAPHHWVRRPCGNAQGPALCRIFNRAIRGQRWMPKYVSSDNDPLYRFH